MKTIPVIRKNGEDYQVEDSQARQDVSDLKSALKDINDVININKTSSTQYFAFDFVLGYQYTLYNGTASALNAYTVTEPSS